MIFTETKLPGAFIIDIEKRGDDRGFFARTWCQREFEEHRLNIHLVQTNLAFTKSKGVLRGMHYQAPPHAEAKLIRCTSGAIIDMIIDLRPESVTFKQWLGTELTASNRRMLYVPEGFAHGYLTVEDNSEVVYQVSEFYCREAERGLRYDDPAFGVEWPIEVRTVSEKDRSWPDYVESDHSMSIIAS